MRTDVAQTLHGDMKNRIPLVGAEFTTIATTGASRIGKLFSLATPNEPGAYGQLGGQAQ